MKVSERGIPWDTVIQFVTTDYRNCDGVATILPRREKRDVIGGHSGECLYLILRQHDACVSVFFFFFFFVGVNPVYKYLRKTRGNCLIS